MVLTISPNKVSGPNNVIKKHMKIPTTQLLFTHAPTHAHTHTHTNTHTNRSTIVRMQVCAHTLMNGAIFVRTFFKWPELGKY